MNSAVNCSPYPPFRVKNLQYAADAAAAMLPAYEAALGVAYPLEKLDLVAVPDFSAGAMENWGARQSDCSFGSESVVGFVLAAPWRTGVRNTSIVCS